LDSLLCSPTSSEPNSDRLPARRLPAKLLPDKELSRAKNWADLRMVVASLWHASCFRIGYSILQR
jgi:hypothetical protein